MNVSVSKQVAATLAEIRTLLRRSSSANDVLWAPKFESHHVAFLTTVDAVQPRCVILLKHGTSEIGRSCPEYVALKGPLTGVVEAWQWRIECKLGAARVQDVRSTDGSVLLPSGSELVSLERARKAGAGTRLGWDGVDANEAFAELAEGSILVNQYRAFAFGWTESARMER